MSEWRESSLGSVCSRLRSGNGITAKDIHESGEFPVFGGNGIRGYASEANFSGECAIIGRQGAYCGNVRYFSGSARMSEHAVVVCADSANDTRFLAYLLSTMNLGRLSGQAAQPGLSVKVLAQQPVRLPSLKIQRRVASLLASFDELIENNRRRVDVLESMARAIYREWFVELRYPGHESVPLIDSALGPIPEGWEVRIVKDMSSLVSRGISPKYAERGESVVLNQKCIRDGRVSFGPSRRQERNVPEVKLVRFGDVLINSTGVGTLGRVAMYRGSWDNVTVDSHVTIARPAADHLNPWYGLSMLAKQSDIERLGTGATGQTELRKADVETLNLMLPTRSVLDAFASVVCPILEEADKLLANIEATAGLRDLLLPKLVTGQVDVSDLDLGAVIEESVA